MQQYGCPFSNATLDLERLGTGSKAVVLICPGGAYQMRASREMWPVGNAFLFAGYSAAVLQYTVGQDLGLQPLREAGWAVGQLRELFPDLPVIVMGFSAGGHLAASLAVHGRREGLAFADATVLCYPVISSGPFAHRQSIANLGPSPLPRYFSLEEWVDETTKPVFLWHTASDRDVPVENSLLFAQALARAKVPFALHVYPFGEHGLSLATKEVDEPEKNRLSDPQVATWFELCLTWLASLELGKKE